MKTCFECDRPAEHDHHVVPESRGGTKTIPLCGRCHGKVHDLELTDHVALTRLGLERNRANGERVGNVPFGYRADPGGGLHEEPTEQATMRRAWTLRDLGLSYRAIQRALEAEGFRGRTGRPLTLRRVHKTVAERYLYVIVSRET